MNNITRKVESHINLTFEEHHKMNVRKQSVKNEEIKNYLLKKIWKTYSYGDEYTLS